MQNQTKNLNAVEAELTVPKRGEGELAFLVAGVEFGLELEQLKNGKVALTFEAEKAEDDDDDDDDDDDGPDDDGYQFVFSPYEGFEDSFEIKVAGRTYLIELEAGLETDDDDDDDDDDDGEVEAPELVAEVEVTPIGPRKRTPLEAELEIEAARGQEIDGSLEYRGLEIELGLEPAGARGRHYTLEVEIVDERTGDSYEREFRFRSNDGFEREIEISVGGRKFELELEVERDREDDTVVASLEIERAWAPHDNWDALI